METEPEESLRMLVGGRLAIQPLNAGDDVSHWLGLSFNTR